MGAIVFIILGIVAAGAAFIYVQQLPPLPPDVATSIASVVGWAWAANGLFPVDTLFLILGLVLACELILLKLGLISWGLSKVQGAAAAGAAE